MSFDFDQKLRGLMSNERAFILRPLWRNFNRNGHYLPNMLAQFTESHRLPYKRTTPSLPLAKHVTFSNINDCVASIPGKYQREWRSKAYTSKSIQYPSMYSLSYRADYGTKSFYVANHIKDFYTDKCLFDSLVLRVSLHPITRKTANVPDDIKEDNNNTLQNQYPKELKSRYYLLKERFSKHLSYLTKNIKNRSNTSPIYTHKIELRYDDEDALKHINHTSYFLWAQECLMSLDKDLVKGKKTFFSMSAMFWKEITIKSWRTCYVHIWDIENDKSDVNIEKCDYYGSIDVCFECCSQDMNQKSIESNHVHEWKHYTGFVTTVIGKNNKHKL